MGKGRAPCCDKSKVKKGPWSPAEDLRLIAFIQKYGHGNWRSLPKQAGLLRCGKSCRLRWINYLRPDVKRGNFTPEEEDAIIKLHNSLGNRWSQIASHLPGRTDNEIKNIWNTHLKKRLNGKQPFVISSSSPSSSSSSISSHASHFSNSIQSLDGSMAPNGEMGSQFTFSDTNEQENIPLEFDVDFWSMLDNLDSSEAQTNQFEASQSQNFKEEESDREVECMKWIKSLENELGLVGPNCDRGDQNNSADQFVVDENDHMGLQDYSPLWPSSPHNFYI